MVTILNFKIAITKVTSIVLLNIEDKGYTKITLLDLLKVVIFVFINDVTLLLISSSY